MRFVITLPPAVGTALKEMMSEDMQTNRTAYIVGLIGAEKKRREEIKNKRGVGRPRKEDEDKDYSDDLPKNIPHFGRMIGKQEAADIESVSNEFQPKGV